MIRAAAFLLLGALAATPAAAACRTAAEAVPSIRKLAGADSVVRALPDWIAPAVVDWVRTRGAPDAAASGIVAAVAPHGIILFPTQNGQVCDGSAWHVTVEATPDFLSFVRDWMDARGPTKERSA